MKKNQKAVLLLVLLILLVSVAGCDRNTNNINKLIYLDEIPFKKSIQETKEVTGANPINITLNSAGKICVLTLHKKEDTHYNVAYYKLNSAELVAEAFTVKNWKYKDKDQNTKYFANAALSDLFQTFRYKEVEKGYEDFLMVYKNLVAKYGDPTNILHSKEFEYAFEFGTVDFDSEKDLAIIKEIIAEGKNFDIYASWTTSSIKGEGNENYYMDLQFSNHFEGDNYSINYYAFDDTLSK